MDSNLNINQAYKYEFNSETLNNDIIDELEFKWKEIENMTQEKLNKNKESRILNNLNNFSIMRINLNSLIHPIDDSLEFENYCNLKIKQLDKIIYSIDKENKYNSNLINLNSFNNDIIFRNQNNNIKSFLKPDDDNESENQLGYNKYKRNTINELINNKNKKKRAFKHSFNYTNSNNNDDIYNNNKTFNYDSNRNNFDNMDDTFDYKLDKFAKKLNEIKNTFLINDKNIKTINNDLLSTKDRGKFNKYKFDYKNNDIFSGYNSSKNKTISHKIEDNYKYFYRLYPKLKNNKDN